MTVDEVTKLIYAVGITSSIIGVSYALFRVLQSVAKNLDDLRRTVKNVGVLTDGFVEDQHLIKQAIQNFVDISDKLKGLVSLITKRIIEPITAISAFLGVINTFLNRIKERFSK